jgi:hypothetical protein
VFQAFNWSLEDRYSVVKASPSPSRKPRSEAGEKASEKNRRVHLLSFLNSYR